MQLTTLDYALWALSTALQVGVCILVVRSRSYRSLPLFSAYTWLNLIGLSVGWWAYLRLGYSSRISFNIAWAAFGIVLAARGLAVAELCRRVLRPYDGVWALAWRLLVGVAMLLLVYAGLAVFGVRGGITAFLLTAEHGLELAAALVLLLLLAISNYYHIRVPTLEGMVALGLGVGLGLVLSVAVAGSLTADLQRLSDAAARVGTGDLASRTGIERRDELGRVAEAFDEMMRQLEQARRQRERDEQERRELVQSIGHDLRTPLASLQAAVEALQDGLAADPERYLRAMAGDIQHLRALIDDLLLISRLESGRVQFQPIMVDLAELADEAVEALEPVAAVRKVALGVLRAGSFTTKADPAGVGRIFRNLLDNAIRHSPEGGRVTVELRGEERTLTATVMDEGTGFDAPLRERAFERFTRGDEARRRDGGGSGLGLAIARGLVEGQGGTITILDGPGGRVRFSLPKA